MFAVMVAPAARKNVCTSGLVWVRDDYHEFYVAKKDRGEWESREEAARMITESWEVVIEVPNA
jgi:hypothetical protein